MYREERFVALLQQPIFAQLDVEDLSIVADIARERHVQVGAILVRAESLMPALFIPLKGELHLGDGSPCDLKYQLRHLMHAHALPQHIQAGQKETLCLSIGRSHMFTLLRNCAGLSDGIIQAMISQDDEAAHEL